MDLASLEEKIKCNKCRELFDEDARCPRVLICKHTFCHTCLEKILLQSPQCPSCEADIIFERADLIPTNFTVKQFILTLKQIGASSLSEKSLSPSATKLASVGYCSDHFSFRELRCMSCEFWICAMCATLNHKFCRTLLVKEALKEMKRNSFKRVENELELININSFDMAESLKILKKEREDLVEEIKKKENQLQDKEKCIKDLELKISDGIKFCEKLKNLSTLIENSPDDKEFSKATNELDELLDTGMKQLAQLEALEFLIPRKIERLKFLCDSQQVYAVENQETLLYGKVQVKEDQIWISSFQSIKPKARLIPFRKLLSILGRYSELPKKAFFTLTEMFSTDAEVDIVIETEGEAHRAHNFILRCSALKGEGYKGAFLTKKESTRFGNLSTSNARRSTSSQNRPSVKATARRRGSDLNDLFDNVFSRGSRFDSDLGQLTRTTMYNPVTDTDTMELEGTTQTIQTKIEVITVMKEYESKSLEELRVEDYLGNKFNVPSRPHFLYHLTNFHTVIPVVEGISTNESLAINENGIVLSITEKALPFGSSSIFGKSLPLSNSTSSGSAFSPVVTGFSFGPASASTNSTSLGAALNHFATSFSFAPGNASINSTSSGIAFSPNAPGFAVSPVSASTTSPSTVAAVNPEITGFRFDPYNASLNSASSGSAFSPATSSISSSSETAFSTATTSRLEGNPRTSISFGASFNSVAGSAGRPSINSTTTLRNSTIFDNFVISDSTPPHHKIGVVISGFQKVIESNKKILKVRDCGIIM